MDGGATARRETESRALTLLPPARLLPPAPIGADAKSVRAWFDDAVETAEAVAKAARKRTDPADGEVLPVHSFRTLLADLATLTRNVVQIGRDSVRVLHASPTPLQRRALDPVGAQLAP